MHDRITALGFVDGGEANDTTCACGARMVFREEDGALWLICSRYPETRKGGLGRLRSLGWPFGHDRRLVVDADEVRAA